MGRIRTRPTQRKTGEEPQGYIEAELLRVGRKIKCHGSMSTTPRWLLHRYADLCWKRTIATALEGVEL